MTRSVQNFRNRLRDGGARSNLFRVLINYPSFVNGNTEDSSYMAKGASIPGHPMGSTELNFRGRAFSLPGDRPENEPWTVTFYNTSDFSIHDAMTTWQDGINNMLSNTPDADPSEWDADLIVEQLNANEEVIKRVRFQDAWPENIGPIELDFDTTDTIEQFEVTFKYLVHGKV